MPTWYLAGRERPIQAASLESPLSVPQNALVAEDGVTLIMAEDGATFVVSE